MRTVSLPMIMNLAINQLMNNWQWVSENGWIAIRNLAFGCGWKNKKLALIWKSIVSNHGPERKDKFHNVNMLRFGCIDKGFLLM